MPSLWTCQTLSPGARSAARGGPRHWLRRACGYKCRTLCKGWEFSPLNGSSALMQRRRYNLGMAHLAHFFVHRATETARCVCLCEVRGAKRRWRVRFGPVLACAMLSLPAARKTWLFPLVHHPAVITGFRARSKRSRTRKSAAERRDFSFPALVAHARPFSSVSTAVAGCLQRIRRRKTHSPEATRKCARR